MRTWWESVCADSESQQETESSHRSCMFHEANGHFQAQCACKGPLSSLHQRWQTFIQMHPCLYMKLYEICVLSGATYIGRSQYRPMGQMKQMQYQLNHRLGLHTEEKRCLLTPRSAKKSSVCWKSGPNMRMLVWWWWASMICRIPHGAITFLL